MQMSWSTYLSVLYKIFPVIPYHVVSFYKKVPVDIRSVCMCVCVILVTILLTIINPYCSSMLCIHCLDLSICTIVSCFIQLMPYLLFMYKVIK